MLNAAEMDRIWKDEIEKEKIKDREEGDKLLEELKIKEGTNSSLEDLKSNIIFSNLREKRPNEYKQIAEALYANPSYKKYIKQYSRNGSNYFIYPSLKNSNDKNSLYMKSVEYTTSGNSIDFSERVTSDYSSEKHPYGKSYDVLPVCLREAEEIEKGKVIEGKTISMNRYTGELVDVDPSDFKLDSSAIEAKIQSLDNGNTKKLTECSQSLQDSIKSIYTKKDELQEKTNAVEDEKEKIIECIRKSDFSGAIKGIYDLVKTFFSGKKKLGRVINVGKDINYEGDENDYDYLENAIKNVFEPEKRTQLTYLLSKIKDKRKKEELKQKGKENPTQLDLMLQNCEVGQVMLTNALDREGNSSNFKIATQTVSGARWCHALMISGVEKDSNGVVTDLKVVQSTLSGGVHETSFKKYLSENYSSSDFMLADLPENKKDAVLQNAKSKIGQKYDRLSIVTDSVMGTFGGRFNIGKEAAYCSELVFDAMESAECELPTPRVAPSDLLLTGDISPKYCCYCDNL